MRICGFAAEGLRSERLIHETFPIKELQDYFSARPRYEEVDISRKGEFISGGVVANAGTSETGDHSHGGQTYAEWLAGQKEEKEELPPPPYTLEANEEAGAVSSVPAPSAPSPVVADARRSSIPPSSAVTVAPILGPTPGQFHQHNVQNPPVVHSTNSPTRETYNNVGSSQAIANNSTYSGHASTPHSGLGNPTSQSQQAYPPPSAYGPPPSIDIQHPPPQQQQHQQDPVSTLTYGFERQSLSSSSPPPSHSNVDLVRRTSAGATISSAPIQSALPGTGPGTVGAYPSRPTSGQSNGQNNHGQSHYNYPQEQQHAPPPTSQLGPRPSFSARPTLYQNQPGPRPPQQAIGGGSSSQWPPPEWGVRPSSTGPSSSSTPIATLPHSTYISNSGGANLTRPQSFAASTVAGTAAGANLRPHSSLSARPSTATSYTTTPSTASSVPYPPYNNYIPSPYVPPRPTSSQSHGHSNSYGQSPTHASFPSAGPPPASSYAPLPPSVSTYPGSTQGSYTPTYGAPTPWGGAPSPHASPPRSPTAFSDHPSYPPYGYNPSLPPSHNPTPSSYPHGPRTSSPPPTMMPSSEGVYFPQAEDSYYGGGGGGSNNLSMPGTEPYGSSSYSNPYGGSSSSFSYPQVHPATPPLDAGSSGPWVPGTNTGSAPSLPPRESLSNFFCFAIIYSTYSLKGTRISFRLSIDTGPPVHASMNSGYTGNSSYGSNSNYGGSNSKISGAFGLALSAVDKVAGKKTREQLESQVGNLAQSELHIFRLCLFPCLSILCSGNQALW